MSSAEPVRDLCFVVMPFGTKSDTAGPVAFDAVYRQIIAPAVEAAGLEVLRADEEMSGGIIHKPMFERLILCRFAVADLTTANANVFYELGVRHAARPGSTVLLFAAGRGQLPFDVAPLRALPYQLDASGAPSDAANAVKQLTARLQELRKASQGGEQGDFDSPISALLDDYSFPDIARLKTDVFRERVQYAKGIKEKLAAARRSGLDAVRAVERELPNLDAVESAAVIDLFLSYRAVKGWQEMIDLAARIPKPLAATVMVREQLALALNRAGDDRRAEEVLLDVLESRGPSSETYGLLGRIYKDRWERARNTKQPELAEGYLDQAIDAYRKGFEADWRDAYPGINAVTLMELREPPDPAREELLPVVRYAVNRRLAGSTPDYWDHATLLELAVLGRDRKAASQSLGKALVKMREGWEGETTARNLRLIGESRSQRGEESEWIEEMAAALTKPRG
jgi:tetratricopeptide (TPR) repeat protein